MSDLMTLIIAEAVGLPISLTALIWPSMRMARREVRREAEEQVKDDSGQLVAETEAYLDGYSR